LIGAENDHFCITYALFTRRGDGAPNQLTPKIGVLDVDDGYATAGFDPELVEQTFGITDLRRPLFSLWAKLKIRGSLRIIERKHTVLRGHCLKVAKSDFQAEFTAK